MTYVYFAPKDLRDVDPRPTPTIEAAEATVTRMLENRFVGNDLTNTMMALGLLPYERAFNPNGRDAWTKKPSHVKRDAARKLACPRGHDRVTHSTEDRSGRPYCMTCKRADGERRRELARLRGEQSASGGRGVARAVSS